MDINEILKSKKLLPIITLKSTENIQTVKKVIEGSDIGMVEVAFRSELAAEAIKEYSTIDNVIIGAGTVRTLEEAKQAIEAGAKFIVSPMYDTEVVKYSLANDTPIFPGVLTPYEIQKGINEADLSIFKLFPANLLGGLDAVKALKGPFYDVQFLPTGGVNAENYLDFLADDQIIAVGGSFIINDSVSEDNVEQEISKINNLIENAKNI